MCVCVYVCACVCACVSVCVTYLMVAPLLGWLPSDTLVMLLTKALVVTQGLMHRTQRWDLGCLTQRDLLLLMVQALVVTQSLMHRTQRWDLPVLLGCLTQRDLLLMVQVLVVLILVHAGQESEWRGGEGCKGCCLPQFALLRCVC